MVHAIIIFLTISLLVLVFNFLAFYYQKRMWHASFSNTPKHGLQVCLVLVLIVSSYDDITSLIKVINIQALYFRYLCLPIVGGLYFNPNLLGSKFFDFPLSLAYEAVGF